MSLDIAAICARAPVIPVVVIEDVAKAVPLARALVASGLPVIEVTLRTPQALDAIRRIAAEVPEVIVGAGTILNGDDLEQAIKAGARFGVSPGSTPALLDAVTRRGLPFLPGAATASEAMGLLARGYATQKFFPAEAAGGIPALKALAGPLPGVRFCPTGGVGSANAATYLALTNVICIGGSWVAPAEAIQRGEFACIESERHTRRYLIQRLDQLRSEEACVLRVERQHCDNLAALLEWKCRCRCKPDAFRIRMPR